MNWASNVAVVLLDSYKHLYTETVLYMQYLCPYLGLGLFLSYLCDLFFIFIFILILINQSHGNMALCVFRHFIEYLLLFLDDDMDKKCGYFPT